MMCDRCCTPLAARQATSDYSSAADVLATIRPTIIQLNVILLFCPLCFVFYDAPPVKFHVDGFAIFYRVVVE